MKKFITILLVALLITALVAVRGYIQPYFYDPLVEFFKNDYLYNYLPEIVMGKYFWHIFLRYSLNSIISLGIIYLIFKDSKKIIFSIKFFIAAFLFLVICLFLILNFDLSESYLLLFYLRRFLIQPLFLFILIAAFYYQNLREGK